MSAIALTQTLRPYQNRGVDELRIGSWRNRGKRRTLMVLPTGGGKTSCSAYTIAGAVDAPGDRSHVCLFFAHRKELIEQAHARLAQYGVHGGLIHGKTQCSRCKQDGRHTAWIPSIGKERCPRCGFNQIDEDLSNPVQVSSVQTLSRRLERLIAWATGRRVLIFIDEAHRVQADTYLAVLETIRSVARSVIVVGLTATPYRLDGQGLDDTFDDLIEMATPTFLFDTGSCPVCKQERPRGSACCGHLIRSYLVRPQAYGIAAPSMKGVQSCGGDFNTGQVAERMNQVKLVADIVQTWRHRAEGLCTVGFAVNIKHSKDITEAFLAAGIPFAHIDKDTDPDDRADILARLSIGELLGVVNCGVLAEGWDSESDYARVLKNPARYWRGKSYPPPYKPLQVAIDACPTQSMGRYFQGPIGRITRNHPDKDVAIYLGHAGNPEPPPEGRGYGLPDTHHGFDLSGYKRRRDAGHVAEMAPTDIIRCKTCFAVFQAGTPLCTDCGALLGRPRNIVTVAGELQLITASENAARAHTPAEKEVQYVKLMGEARAQGQRPYFADDNYRSLYGQLPTVAMKQRVYMQFGYGGYLR